MTRELRAVIKASVFKKLSELNSQLGLKSYKHRQQFINPRARARVTLIRFSHGTSVVSVGMVGACQRTSGGSSYKRLTRANGWGSAGQCPASACAKTPAARERDSHLVANTSARSPVQAAVGGGVEA